MLDLYDSLRTICDNRQSIRSFSEKPISDELIEKIKAIALTSPYASNRKNWEIEIIRDKKTIYQIAQLIRNSINVIKKNVRDDLVSEFESYSKSFTCFETAPILFIPTFRIVTGLTFMMKKKNPGIKQWERDNLIKSISCVSMLIIIAAESLGLGSCFMTGPLIAEEDIGELINIKHGRNIGALIPVGYAKED